MLFSIFYKLTREKVVSDKFAKKDPFVYLYVLFPLTVAFLITFIGARMLSLFAPDFYPKFIPELHIHHFTYGLVILAISGYLALVFNSPKQKYLISLLHGLGLGLAFDEFEMLLRLSDESQARWSYDGIIVLIAVFFLIISAKSGVQAFKWYLTKKGPIKAPDLGPKGGDFGGFPRP